MTDTAAPVHTHTHPDPDRLTLHCDACIRRAYPSLPETARDAYTRQRRRHITRLHAANENDQ